MQCFHMCARAGHRMIHGTLYIHRSCARLQLSQEAGRSSAEWEEGPPARLTMTHCFTGARYFLLARLGEGALPRCSPRRKSGELCTSDTTMQLLRVTFLCCLAASGSAYMVGSAARPALASVRSSSSQILMRGEAKPKAKKLTPEEEREAAIAAARAELEAARAEKAAALAEKEAALKAAGKKSAAPKAKAAAAPKAQSQSAAEKNALAQAAREEREAKAAEAKAKQAAKKKADKEAAIAKQAEAAIAKKAADEAAAAKRAAAAAAKGVAAPRAAFKAPSGGAPSGEGSNTITAAVAAGAAVGLLPAGAIITLRGFLESGKRLRK